VGCCRNAFVVSLLVVPLACSSAASEAVPSPPAPPPPASAITPAIDENRAQRGPTNYPLQAWMKANMATAVAAGDVARLPRAFSRVMALAPPGYERWGATAQSGLEAAQRGDLETAKHACKECHDEYRGRYRNEWRTRPM